MGWEKIKDQRNQRNQRLRQPPLVCRPGSQGRVKTTTEADAIAQKQAWAPSGQSITGTHRELALISGL